MCSAMPLPSKRDYQQVAQQLATWLATRLPEGTAPTIVEFSVPEGSGFSSETLLFTAAWVEGGEPRTRRLVARLQPEMSDFPVFPEYDLELQYNCLQLIAEHTSVPVPSAPWIELDEQWLGTSFYVMDRVDGDVPTDQPPYVVGGWLYEASPEQQAQVSRHAIATLAAIHTLDPAVHPMGFLDRPQYGATPLEQHLNYQRWYYDWARDGESYELIDGLFAWLEAHRPTEESPTTINWGDARVGNMMFRDFTPVAVLDWEMAALGAPEVDLGWMLFMHAFWQDMINRYGMPGLPDFMVRSESIALYEEATGRPARNVDFWEVFAALRFAIVSVRTSARGVAYGQMEKPADREDVVMFRSLAQSMLDGTYWDAQR
jgi:aminoglycoside phosphotransferase (APT) family kinase protein